MSGNVTILGLRELGSTCDMLTQQVQRQIIRKAANAGAEVFRREIRARAPVRDDQYVKGKNIKRGPGYLKKHIGKRSKTQREGNLVVSVGPTKSAYYARFLEIGTGHQAAQQFIRPAFDSKTPEAEKVFADTMKVGIAAALK